MFRISALAAALASVLTVGTASAQTTALQCYALTSDAVGTQKRLSDASILLVLNPDGKKVHIYWTPNPRAFQEAAAGKSFTEVVKSMTDIGEQDLAINPATGEQSFPSTVGTTYTVAVRSNGSLTGRNENSQIKRSVTGYCGTG